MIPVRSELLDEVGDEHLTLLCEDREVWEIFSPFEPSGLLSSASARKKHQKKETWYMHMVPLQAKDVLD